MLGYYINKGGLMAGTVKTKTEKRQTKTDKDIILPLAFNVFKLMFCKDLGKSGTHFSSQS